MSRADMIKFRDELLRKYAAEKARWHSRWWNRLVSLVAVP